MKERKMVEHVFSSFRKSLGNATNVVAIFASSIFAIFFHESYHRSRVPGSAEGSAFARPTYGRREHACVAGASAAQALMMARDGTRGTPSPLVFVALLFDRRDGVRSRRREIIPRVYMCAYAYACVCVCVCGIKRFT